jgi:cytochrome P450/NADPH-cytochrome P450 reductase
VGQAVLYFGCRRPEEDFLYREDLEVAKQDGTLSRLEVAFSRATQDKVYVQHLMRNQVRPQISPNREGRPSAQEAEVETSQCPSV